MDFKGSGFDSRFGFGNKLGLDLLRQLKRVQENKASLIIVDGGLGSGKTTLAVQISDFLTRGSIDLKQQLSLGGSDFQVKIKECVDNNLKVLIYDEAGDMSKKATMTKLSRNLSRVFDVVRTFKMIIIIVLPDALKLDSHVVSSKIARLLIHCEERTAKGGKYKVYSLADYYWLCYHAKKNIVKPSVYKMQYPLYEEHFTKLNGKRQRELDEISQNSKKDMLDEKAIEARGLYSTKTLCAMVGCTPSSLKTKIFKLKIKPVVKQKGLNYYDNIALQMLRNTNPPGRPRKH